MIGIGGVARQPFPGIAGRKNLNPAVAGVLGKCRIEGHKLVPEFATVLVDGRKDRRRLRQAKIGLVKRDLRGIDGLRRHHASPDDVLPVLRVGGLALPECRHSQALRASDDDAVDVTLDAAAGDGKPELIAAPVSGPKVEARLAQPVDGEILETVAGRKDAQGLTAEVAALVTGNLEVFILQAPGTDITEPAPAQVVTLRPCHVVRNQRRVNQAIDRVARNLEAFPGD